MAKKKSSDFIFGSIIGIEIGVVLAGIYANSGNYCPYCGKKKEIKKENEAK